MAVGGARSSVLARSGDRVARQLAGVPALVEGHDGRRRQKLDIEHAGVDVAIESGLHGRVEHQRKLVDRLIIRSRDDAVSASLGDERNDPAFIDEVERRLHPALTEQRDDGTDFLQLEVDAEILRLVEEHGLDITLGGIVDRSEHAHQLLLGLRHRRDAGIRQDVGIAGFLRDHISRTGRSHRDGKHRERSNSRFERTLHWIISLVYPIENPGLTGVPAYLGMRIISGYIKTSRAVRGPPC